MERQQLTTRLNAAIDQVRESQASGTVPRYSTADVREDFAYGQAKVDNSSVTREHARIAVTKVPGRGPAL
ncbi:MAG: hypothetical protein H6718_03195 [Polyangiaceae bacterium]|nr:hypothetical protein [Myxococcales bacterium]MCB9584372.1 hypothetical protein [Polyangiaceae bacterium]